eukprot:1160857-Pelagomonas_calceolata.AAC.4
MATCTLGRDYHCPFSLIADLLQTLKQCTYAWPMQLSAWSNIASKVVLSKRSLLLKHKDNSRLKNRAH